MAVPSYRLCELCDRLFTSSFQATRVDKVDLFLCSDCGAAVGDRP